MHGHDLQVCLHIRGFTFNIAAWDVRQRILPQNDVKHRKIITTGGPRGLYLATLVTREAGVSSLASTDIMVFRVEIVFTNGSEECKQIPIRRHWTRKVEWGCSGHVDNIEVVYW